MSDLTGSFRLYKRRALDKLMRECVSTVRMLAAAAGAWSAFACSDRAAGPQSCLHLFRCALHTSNAALCHGAAPLVLLRCSLLARRPSWAELTC